MTLNGLKIFLNLMKALLKVIMKKVMKDISLKLISNTQKILDLLTYDLPFLSEKMKFKILPNLHDK